MKVRRTTTTTTATPTGTRQRIAFWRLNLFLISASSKRRTDCTYDYLLLCSSSSVHHTIRTLGPMLHCLQRQHHHRCHYRIDMAFFLYRRLAYRDDSSLVCMCLVVPAVPTGNHVHNTDLQKVWERNEARGINSSETHNGGDTMVHNGAANTSNRRDSHRSL